MPNHVESSWLIKGPIEDLEKLLDTIKGKNWHGDKSIFTPHKIIPMPQELITASDDAKSEKLSAWYDWSVKNWGSKWEPYEVSIHKWYPPNSLRLINDLANKGPVPGKLYIHFQTAWSPITPVIQKLSEMFPTLHFTYAFLDEGMGFAVIQTYQEGKILEEREMKKSNSKDTVYRAVKNKLRLGSGDWELIEEQD